MYKLVWSADSLFFVLGGWGVRGNERKNFVSKAVDENVGWAKCLERCAGGKDMCMHGVANRSFLSVTSICWLELCAYLIRHVS